MTRFLVCLIVLGACGQSPKPLTETDVQAVLMPTPEVRALVEDQVPDALRDMQAIDAAVLAKGRALTPQETAMAIELGVRQPDKVRVREVRRRDMPGQSGLGFRTIGGLTTGYGITVVRGMVDDWLIAHELVHVRQFEQLGPQAFVRRFLTERAALQGRLIPMEREAIADSARLLGKAVPDYAF